MSEGREDAHWVKNIMHNPTVSFRVVNTTFKGTARVVDQKREPVLAAEVSKLMSRKYNWDEGLIVELIPANAPQ